MFFATVDGEIYGAIYICLLGAEQNLPFVRRDQLDERRCERLPLGLVEPSHVVSKANHGDLVVQP